MIKGIGARFTIEDGESGLISSFVCMPLDASFLKYSQIQGASPIANSRNSFVVSYTQSPHNAVL
jgi:hypothetical protein